MTGWLLIGGYVVVWFVFAAWLYLIWRAEMSDTSTEESMVAVMAALYAVLWPFTLPLFAMAWLIRRIGNSMRRPEAK